ncbi:MAG: 2-haloacid dehalogenase [Gammaproteobacteria bacterium]|jgi:2-haloacid dehalogenase
MMLMRRPELVTFDVYMALLDIQGGMVPVFAQATGANEEACGVMVAAWRAKQMERAASSNSLELGRTSFRQCTELGLDYVCARYALQVSAQVRQQLVSAWDTLTPWPEADAALRAIKAKGYAIAILSNGDQSMLEALAAQFTTRFDHVLSSETAGKYKPHPSVYALPQQRLGIATDDTLHVAGSANDVLGTVAFGMACVWSNKGADVLVDPAYPPTHEISTLAQLPALL